jgi:hypothetical protein
MKKIILFAVLAIVFASCKKSGSGSPLNTITATINDTVYTFNNNILDTTIYESADSELGIELRAQDVNLNTIIFVIANANAAPLKPITYGSSGDTSHLSEMLFTTTKQTLWGTGFPPSVENPFVVNVTTLTSTTIQGTFKGTLFFQGDTASADKKTVTNGTFSFTKPVTIQ